VPEVFGQAFVECDFQDVLHEQLQRPFGPVRFALAPVPADQILDSIARYCTRINDSH
jgi:hypothetical protein